MDRTIGIMQPYFFPYPGYFQLVGAVDLFVFYDDVDFITRGWINRNRVLVNGEAKYWTVPCRDASQNRLICDTDHALDDKTREKLLKTIRFSYANAPYFDAVFPIVQSVLHVDAGNIGALAIKSVEACMDYLALDTATRVSSENYDNRSLGKAGRLIDICKQENGSRYVNAPGGREIYEKSTFEARGIELYFLETGEITYEQFDHPFVPNLSIIDMLMFNDPEIIKTDFLNRYTLI